MLSGSLSAGTLSASSSGPKSLSIGRSWSKLVIRCRICQVQSFHSAWDAAEKQRLRKANERLAMGRAELTERRNHFEPQ
jgi:hypothetical protein